MAIPQENPRSPNGADFRAPSRIPNELLFVPETPLDRTLAIISPGQGSQKVGIGQDIREWSPAANAVWQMGHEMLGDYFMKIVREGPEEELTKTSITQPAVALNSLARMATLREIGRFDNAGFYTGNSLGFYPAMVNVGVITIEEGIKLIQLRGIISQETDAGESSMVAVTDADESLPSELENKFGLYLCLDNTENQKVFGGDRDAIEEAQTWMLTDRKLKGVHPLAIDRAFHSPYMQKAAEPLRNALGQINIQAPTNGELIGICSVKPLREPREIVEELLNQFTTTVRWKDAMRFLQTQGVSTIVELDGVARLTSMNTDLFGGERSRLAPEKQDGKGRPPTIVYMWTSSQTS